MLFESPTVAGLAERLLEVSGGGAEIEKTAELLLQLLDLSDDEVDAMLADRAPTPEEGDPR